MSRSSVIDQKQLFDSWDETGVKRKPGRWWRLRLEWAFVWFAGGNSVGGRGIQNRRRSQTTESTAYPRTLNGWNMCIGENFEAELVHCAKAMKMVKEFGVMMRSGYG
jgi:hypothetical protein